VSIIIGLTVSLDAIEEASAKVVAVEVVTKELPVNKETSVIIEIILFLRLFFKILIHSFYVGLYRSLYNYEPHNYNIFRIN